MSSRPRSVGKRLGAPESGGHGAGPCPQLYSGPRRRTAGVRLWGECVSSVIVSMRMKIRHRYRRHPRCRRPDHETGAFANLDPTSAMARSSLRVMEASQEVGSCESSIGRENGIRTATHDGEPHERASWPDRKSGQETEQTRRTPAPTKSATNGSIFSAGSRSERKRYTALV